MGTQSVRCWAHRAGIAAASLTCCATWAIPSPLGTWVTTPVNVQMVPGSRILLLGGWEDEIIQMGSQIERREIQAA